ncbi:MAG: hypothetical protein J0L72_08805 [Armatimonadetes bacterium]|nr:hypothetical protein [Armatimonadota bacterium]
MATLEPATMPHARHGHYIAGPIGSFQVPEDFRSIEKAGWTFAAHPVLPIIEVGNTVVIGHAIDADNPVSPASNPNRRFNWGGRWVAFDFDAGYAEGGATMMMPMSFRPSDGVVSSNPYLLSTNLNHRLVEITGHPNSDGYYPLGFTPFLDVEEVLPNHGLNLSTLETFRLRGHPGHGHHTYSETVRKVATNTNLHIRGIKKLGPAVLALTAGNDSRFVLACSRGIEDLTAFSMVSPKIDPIEAKIAGQIAKIAGIPWESVQVQESTEAERKQFFEMVGYTISGGLAYCWRTVSDYMPKTTILNGLGGENFRYVYQKPEDDPDRKITAEEVLKRMRLAIIPEYISRMEKYIHELERDDLHSVLSMSFAEIRLGGWANYQNTLGRQAPNLAPMLSQENLMLMHQIQWEDRIGKSFLVETCKDAWPELLSVPVNTYTGLRGKLYKMQKLGKRAGKKISRILGSK